MNRWRFLELLASATAAWSLLMLALIALLMAGQGRPKK